MSQSKYRIIYKSIDNKKLIYHVDDFAVIKQGTIIRFTDTYTGELKLLPAISTEIKELEQDGMGLQ